MSSPSLRKDIQSAFAGVGLDHVDADIISRCVGLSASFHISPTQLAESWEAFSLNKDVSELTDRTYQAYRNAVCKNAEVDEAAVVSRSAMGKRQTSATPLVTPPAKRLLGRDTPKSAVDAIASSSAKVSMSPKQVTPTPNLPSYEDRKNAGKVLVTLNPHNLDPMDEITSEDNKPRCVVSSDAFATTNIQDPYRHMFTTLEERATALDGHLLSLGEDMVEKFEIGKEGNDAIAPLEAVGVPRQDKVCCVGRICNEAHEGRINQTSILLEGNRHSTGGKRVHLDLSELNSSKTSFSVFPGQIVTVEGMNVSGRKLVANRICEGAARPPKETSAEELMHYHYDVQDGKPLKCMSVCGPYTSSDNLEYQPLTDILNCVSTEKPDVVILAGPFVDMRHDLVKGGNTVLEAEDGTQTFVTYETFFANKVAAMIEELFAEEEGLQTQFVLVPSLDDAVAEWVYPQPPMTDRLSNGGKEVKLPNAEGVEFGTLGLQYVDQAGGAASHKRVHLVSNPCTLQINELVVGVTSTDTLFHISADETNGNLEPGSRLGRIAQHLLQQQSYYPLFPPPASANMATNLDLKHMEQWSMPCQPDLLIAPSKLTCFARTVLEDTVVVNPGQLTKGTTGGTYAIMEIHPLKRETLEAAAGTNVEMKHSLQDRIRVEIKRI